MAKDTLFTFIVLGKEVKITEAEINALPQTIQQKEKELLEIKQLYSQAQNRQLLKYTMMLNDYYHNLSKHLLVYRSGIRVKFLTVMIRSEINPVYFVQAQISFNADKSFKSIHLIEIHPTETKQLTQISFNADKSFKSIHLIEIHPTETKQLTHIAKSRLFAGSNTTAISSNKEFKRKFNRVATLIKENYVKRDSVGAEKCNTMLRGWIAELF